MQEKRGKSPPRCSPALRPVWTYLRYVHTGLRLVFHYPLSWGQNAFVSVARASQREEKAAWMLPAAYEAGPEARNRMLRTGCAPGCVKTLCYSSKAAGETRQSTADCA
jgi:hypothetical protein